LAINVVSSYVYLAIKYSVIRNWRSKERHHNKAIKAASILPVDQSSSNLTWRSTQRYPYLDIKGALSIQGALSLHSNQSSISRTWRYLPGDQSSVNFTWRSKKRHS
jgi:hypothetical protein